MYKEIFLTALKHISHCSRKDRFFLIAIQRDVDKITLFISHSYIKGKSARRSKAGKEIVNKIVHLLPSGDMQEKRTINKITTTLIMSNFFNNKPEGKL